MNRLSFSAMGRILVDHSHKSTQLPRLLPLIRRVLFYIVLLFLVLNLMAFRTVEAEIKCTKDSACEELLYAGSECRNGICSNPFEKGCLRALLSANDTSMHSLSGTDKKSISKKVASLAKLVQSQVRVCNSADPPGAAASGLCVDHTNDGSLFAEYIELRIEGQNWETPVFESWILQIILSEILHVPSTIETGFPHRTLNFYDPKNRFQYGTANDWAALKRAANAPNADCRIVQRKQRMDDNNENEENAATNETETENQEYKSCAHTITELWNGHFADMWENHRLGVIESPQGLGATGQQGIYIPKFTALQDPTLLNYYGLMGDENRQKLAETFLRPTTWKEYCDIVSPTNCTKPDSVAKRPPKDDSEDPRMHVSGIYTGYFRATEDNNCTAHPRTCTGHIADYPCGWSSFVLPQMYHLHIALKSNGDEEACHGYSYMQLVDMWAAANETGSNLMVRWWTPEALYSTFLGTDMEMNKLMLPPPTQVCVDHRVKISQRCNESASFQERVGDPRGACDEAPQMLHKVISSGLYGATYSSKIPDALRSPAYDLVKGFSITELQLGQILKSWTGRGIDKYGFDPRMAVCEWVAENLEYLDDFIPRTYPRAERIENTYETVIFYPAIVLGSLATLMIAVSLFLTYYWRNTVVLKFAQVEFLFILLFGLGLVALASILLATEPSNGTCMCLAWFISLGYTLELVPLIVKVGAINRLLNAAKRMRRVKLTKTQLFGTVAFLSTFVVVFLVLWTVLDPQQRSTEYSLTERETDFGETIVAVNYYCNSNSMVWEYIAAGWQLVLLICATVLAFQTRNIREGFNESQVLAFMIYSHFFFVVLRVITFVLENSISKSHLAQLRSMIYSIDTIVTICIYFIPKFLTKDADFQLNNAGVGSRRTSFGNDLSETSVAAFRLSQGDHRRNSSASSCAFSLNQQVHSDGHPSDRNAQYQDKEDDRGKTPHDDECKTIWKEKEDDSNSTVPNAMGKVMHKHHENGDDEDIPNDLSKVTWQDQENGSHGGSDDSTMSGRNHRYENAANV